MSATLKLPCRRCQLCRTETEHCYTCILACLSRPGTLPAPQRLPLIACVTSCDVWEVESRAAYLHMVTLVFSPTPQTRYPSLPFYEIALTATPTCTGVASCDVWEVDKDPEVLVYGQQADLYGLATNAAFPHVYATCCDSDKVTVWSAATRKVGAS